MKLVSFAIALSLLPLPASAQPATSPPVATSVDYDQRLLLARKAAAAIVAPGTMERVMKMSMGASQEAMMGAMLDTKASDVGATGKDKDQTLRQSISAKDPHWEERMKITNRVMGEEMGKLFAPMEPALREGMAKAYAKRFTVAELTDINRFFSSSAGASFARQSYEMMADPELLKEMMTAMPAMMKAMPAMMAKVKAATAHLPEPPKAAEGDEQDEEDTEADTTS